MDIKLPLLACFSCNNSHLILIKGTKFCSFYWSWRIKKCRLLFEKVRPPPELQKVKRFCSIYQIFAKDSRPSVEQAQPSAKPPLLYLISPLMKRCKRLSQAPTWGSIPWNLSRFENESQRRWIEPGYDYRLCCKLSPSLRRFWNTRTLRKYQTLWIERCESESFSLGDGADKKRKTPQKGPSLLTCFGMRAHLQKGHPWPFFPSTDSNFVLGNAQAKDHPIVYCSDGFCELTGFARAQVMSRSCACRFLWGTDTDDEEKEKIESALVSHSELKTEVIFYKKNSEWKLRVLSSRSRRTAHVGIDVHVNK